MVKVFFLLRSKGNLQPFSKVILWCAEQNFPSSFSLSHSWLSAFKREKEKIASSQRKRRSEEKTLKEKERIPVEWERGAVFGRGLGRRAMGCARAGRDYREERNDIMYAVQLDDRVSCSFNKFHQHSIRSNLKWRLIYFKNRFVNLIKKMFAEFELVSLLYENLTSSRLL